MSRADALRAYKPEEIIVFDAETTGVNSKSGDEILSLAITDGAGKVLFESLFKPVHRLRWPKAQEVNGISPEMVRDKPALLERKEEIERIFSGAKLYVAYNADFDLRMLRDGGLSIPKRPVFDVMKEFAKVHGEWSTYREDWRWFKLSECAAYYGVPTPNAHEALGDVQTTLACFRGLLDDPWFGEPRHRPRVVPDDEAEYEGELDYGDEWDQVYIAHGVDSTPEAAQATPQKEPEESVAPTPERKPTSPRKSRPALAALGGTCCVIGLLLLIGGAWVFGVVLVVLGLACVGASRGFK